jgi:hypothetical protein
MNQLDPPVSDDTLERVAPRAFNFLSGVSGDAVIRNTLAKRGYTVAVHQRGWSLLDEVSGRVDPATSTPGPRDVSVDDAVAEIDAWDETNFAIARAALQFSFSSQCAYVFANGLQAARGRASVLSVMTFLRRLDGLESDPEREATRAQDRAALDTLSQRGIDAKERARLTSLVAAVQLGVSAPVEAPVAPEAPATKPRKARGAEAPAAPVTVSAPVTAARNPRFELYVWLSEWSGVAHAVLKQRKQLIALGLASPRKAKPGVAPAPLPPTK